MCIICDFSSKQTITRVFCLFLAVFLSPRTLYREQESSANMLSRCDVVEFTHRLFCFSLRSSNFLYTYSNIILCKYCAGLSSFYSMALYMVVIDIGYMWMKLKILLIFFCFILMNSLDCEMHLKFVVIWLPFTSTAESLAATATIKKDERINFTVMKMRIYVVNDKNSRNYHDMLPVQHKK